MSKFSEENKKHIDILWKKNTTLGFLHYKNKVVRVG